MFVRQGSAIRTIGFNSLAVLLAAAIGAPALSALAQEGAAPAVRYSRAAAADKDSAGDSASSETSQPVEYAAALDGSGLISMDHTRMTHLLVGSTATGGWDTNPYNVSNAKSSAILALSPYLGFQSSTPRTQILGQYQPTLTRYSSDAYSSQTVHVASLRLMSNLTERWSADVRLYGSYGQDSTRFIAPQQGVAVGSVPGAGASSAAYLLNAGTGTNIEGAFGLHYKKSERDTISLVAANAFSRFKGLGGENSVATSTITFDHGLSPRLGLITYGQGVFYYGTVECQGVGGGLGLKWQINQNSFVSVRGGPQFDTSACKSQQGFAFNASMGTRLNGKSQVYFIAGRQPTVSFLGGGLWQTSVSGGYQRQVGTKGSLSFDLSRLTSDATTAGGAYGGTYFDGVYGRRLGHGMSTTLTYRGYTGSSGGKDLTRNAVMFSLAWTPDAGHILQ